MTKKSKKTVIISVSVVLVVVAGILGYLWWLKNKADRPTRTYDYTVGHVVTPASFEAPSENRD